MESYQAAFVKYVNFQHLLRQAIQKHRAEAEQVNTKRKLEDDCIITAVEPPKPIKKRRRQVPRIRDPDDNTLVNSVAANILQRRPVQVASATKAATATTTAANAATTAANTTTTAANAATTAACPKLTPAHTTTDGEQTPISNTTASQTHKRTVTRSTDTNHRFLIKINRSLTSKGTQTEQFPARRKSTG